MAPVFITTFTLPVTTPLELREYLSRGTPGSNGLDSLAAALLLLKLNLASGSGHPDIISAETTMANQILVECDPNLPAVHNAVMHGTKCTGYSALQIRLLATRLMAYSNGELGVPLCNDIGKGRPSKPRNLMIAQDTK